MGRNGSGGGGLGFVVAIVALVIVLLLTAKAWNALMPTAAQALTPGGAASQVNGWGDRKSAPARGGTAEPPASQTRPSGLPDLKEMGSNTDQHIQQMQDAAAKQD